MLSPSRSLSSSPTPFAPGATGPRISLLLLLLVGNSAHSVVAAPETGPQIPPISVPLAPVSKISVRRLTDDVQRGGTELGNAAVTLGRVSVGKQSVPLVVAPTPGAKKEFEVRVQNVGTASGAFRLTLSRPPTGWTFRLYMTGAEQTKDLAPIAGKALTLPGLIPGETVLLRLEATMRGASSVEGNKDGTGGGSPTPPPDPKSQFILGLLWSTDGNQWHSVNTNKPIQIQRHSTLGFKALLSQGKPLPSRPIGPKWVGMANEVEGTEVWLTPPLLDYYSTRTVTADLNNKATAKIAILPDAYPEIEIGESFALLVPNQELTSPIPILVRVLDEDDKPLGRVRVRLTATPSKGQLTNHWAGGSDDPSVILTTGSDGIAQIEWRGLLSDVNLATTLTAEVKVHVQVIDAFDQAYGDDDVFGLDVYPQPGSTP